MKQFVYYCIIFLLIGCSNSVSKQDLKHLNGYWEIEEVIFSNGKNKKFKVNTTIDYIEVDALKGFRKKMQPKFDGSYTTSDDAKPFTIVENDGALEFYYKNGLSEWTEKITSLSKSNFAVINQDTITYMYKRFQPINGKE